MICSPVMDQLLTHNEVSGSQCTDEIDVVAQLSKGEGEGEGFVVTVASKEKGIPERIDCIKLTFMK